MHPTIFDSNHSIHTQRSTTEWNVGERLRPQRQEVLADGNGRTRVYPHDRAIVSYLFATRFATVSQVQRRFPTWLPSLRTAQRHLARLVELGHLGVVPVRATAPHFPHVYYATQSGVRCAVVGDGFTSANEHHEADEIKGRGYGSQTILHELLLTEFGLLVHATPAYRPDVHVVDTERRYFRRDRQLLFPYQAKMRRLVPDYGFLLRLTASTSKGGLLLAFVEHDNGTSALPRLHRKLLAYHLWSQSTEGQRSLIDLYRMHGADQPRPHYRLVVIAHDKNGTVGDDRRLAGLFAIALELPTPLRNRVWFSTVATLQQQPSNAASLESSAWLSMKDAEPWLQDYQAFKQRLTHASPHRQREERFSFIAERIAAMERRSFLPPLSDSERTPRAPTGPS